MDPLQAPRSNDLAVTECPVPRTQSEGGNKRRRKRHGKKRRDDLQVPLASVLPFVHLANCAVLLLSLRSIILGMLAMNSLRPS
eukprot:6089268-Amphidinium_carterae.1